MNPVILLLEENELYTPELVKRFIHAASDARVNGFLEKLKEAVVKAESQIQVCSPDPLSFYNFMASFSLRGDNCRRVKCRLEKARIVERYSALYCDQIVFPLWYEQDHDYGSPDREVLEGALLSVLQLRRVIEKGYVRLANKDTHLCESCCEKRVPYYHEILEAARDATSRFVEQFTFTVTDRGGPSVHVLIEGPVEFLEHGGKQRIFETRPEWAVSTKGQKKFRIAHEVVRNHDLLRHVFLEPALDVALHQQHHLKEKTNYLTNLEGEAFLASGVLHDPKAMEYAKAAELSHRIPLLQDLDINAILRLREDEHDSFLLYRKALEKSAKGSFSEKRALTQAEVNEMYEDVLLPEVLRLRATLNAKRKFGRLRSVLKSAAAASVVVTLGAFTGPISQRIFEWAATATAVNIGRDLVESAFDPLQSPAEVRQNPMYFLLKASQRLED